jgi:hypothetical protein
MFAQTNKIFFVRLGCSVGLLVTPVIGLLYGGPLRSPHRSCSGCRAENRTGTYLTTGRHLDVLHKIQQS